MFFKKGRITYGKTWGSTQSRKSRGLPGTMISNGCTTKSR